MSAPGDRDAAKPREVGNPPESGETIEMPDVAAWERWLEGNEAAEGVWLRIAKKNASVPPTVSHAEALESALCFGWIDHIRRPLDEHHFLQRFTPRRPRSRWSRVNRDKVERLIAEGRMRAAGLAAVQAAKADGRWEAAYEPQSRARVPEDFQRALDENRPAAEFFATLKGQNRYAFLYRLQTVKRPETRARRIATYIEMLRRGETFYR